MVQLLCMSRKNGYGYLHKTLSKFGICWNLFMLREAVAYNQMADVVVLSEGLGCVVKGCDSEMGARS